MIEKKTFKWMIGVFALSSMLTLLGLSSLKAFGADGDPVYPDVVQSTDKKEHKTVVSMASYFSKEFAMLRIVDPSRIKKEYWNKHADKNGEIRLKIGAEGEEEVHAPENGKSLSKEPYYVFVSYDRKKTTGTFFRTTGFTLSWLSHPHDDPRKGDGRIPSFGKKSSVYKRDSKKSRITTTLYCDKDDPAKNDAITWPTFIVGDDRKSASVWAFPQSTVLNKIKRANKKWGRELEDLKHDGGDYYIGVDGREVAYLNGKLDKNYLYTYKTWEAGKTFKIASIHYMVKDRFGRCLKLHYKEKPKPPEKELYYIIQSDDDSDARHYPLADTIGERQRLTKSVKGAPVIQTYNRSDLRQKRYKYFDISTGIPTTEMFTTGMRNSTWYGEVGVQKVTGYDLGDPFTVTVNAHWAKWEWVTVANDPGPGTHSEYVCVASGTETAKNSVVAWKYPWMFYQLASINMYEMKSASSSNGAYNVVYYTAPDEGSKDTFSAKQGNKDVTTKWDMTDVGVDMNVPFFVSYKDTSGKVHYFSRGHEISDDDYQQLTKALETSNMAGHKFEADIINGDIVVNISGYESASEARAAANDRLDSEIKNRLNKNYSKVKDCTENDIVTLNNEIYVDERNTYIAEKEEGDYRVESDGVMVTVHADNDKIARYKKELYQDENNKSKGDYYINPTEHNTAPMGARCSGTAYHNRVTCQGGTPEEITYSKTPGGRNDLFQGDGTFPKAKKSSYWSNVKEMLAECREDYKAEKEEIQDYKGHCPRFAHLQADVIIPEDTKNGQYYSGIQATYKPFITDLEDSELVDISVSDGYADDDIPVSDQHKSLKEIDGIHAEKRCIYPKPVATLDRSPFYQDPMWSANSPFDDDGTGKIVGNKNFVDNEPVVVHSPVIAPFEITTSKNTQLVDQSGSTDKTSKNYLPQLILDQSYRIKWDWNNYFEKKEKYHVGYNAPAGITKYIGKKEMRFPFACEVNGIFYDVLYDEDGLLAEKSGKEAVYTQWITVYGKPSVEETENGKTTTELRCREGADGKTEFYNFEIPTSKEAQEYVDIYIPAWANEGIYGADVTYLYRNRNSTDGLRAVSIKYNAKKYQIEGRVLANNYTEETAFSDEDNYNDVLSKIEEYKNHVTNEGYTRDQQNADYDNTPEYNHTDENNHNRNKTEKRKKMEELLEWTNTDVSKYEHYQYYSARYSIPVQVSGVIYGFQVDAINDRAKFDPNYDGTRTTGVYNFVSNKEEKKNGALNRFSFYKGDDLTAAYVRNNTRIDGLKDIVKANDKFSHMIKYVRYTKDGAVTNSWDKKNTLAMENGKSSAGQAGMLHPGHKISISLKTIANLSGKKDHVQLIPKYRWVSESKSKVIKSKDLDLYYLDDANNLVKMGSDQDKDNMDKAHLGDQYFNDARYDYLKDFMKGPLKNTTPLANTSEIDGRSENEILNTESEVSCMSRIDIPSTLRLLTADEGELIENVSKDARNKVTDVRPEVKRYEVSRSADYEYGTDIGMDVDGSNDESNKYVKLTSNQYKEFRSSMQTWYATYQIPTNLYVCKKGALENYVRTNGSDISKFDGWIKNGSLILGFDVTTYQNDGTDHPHLEYGSRMFAAENPYKKDTSDPDNPEPDNPEDVGRIDLKTSLSDRFSTTPLYID